MLVLATACAAEEPDQAITSSSSPASQTPAKPPSGTTTAQPPKATPAPLSPARNLVGTWKTPFAVKFYIQTDFRTLDGTLEDAASLDRLMTWIITQGSNENEVRIEVHATDYNVRQVAADPPIAYTPDVFPIGFTAIVSTSRLTTPYGEFNFTTDILTGTWVQMDSLLYTQKEFTKTNALILTRGGTSLPPGYQPPATPTTTAPPATASPTSTALPSTPGVPATLDVTPQEYARLRAVFASWGFDFDGLFAEYSAMAVTEKWTYMWFGSDADTSKRVYFDLVAGKWKPRSIP
jgi:hypothetical protein